MLQAVLHLHTGSLSCGHVGHYLKEKPTKKLNSTVMILIGNSPFKPEAAEARVGLLKKEWQARNSG